MNIQILIAACIGNFVWASTDIITTTATAETATSEKVPEFNVTLVYPESVAVVPVEIEVENNNDANNTVIKFSDPIVVDDIPNTLIVEPVLVKVVDVAPATTATTSETSNFVTASTTEHITTESNTGSTSSSGNNSNDDNNKEKNDEPIPVQRIPVDLKKTLMKLLKNKTDAMNSDWTPIFSPQSGRNINFLPGPIQPQQLVGKDSTVLSRTVRHKTNDKVKMFPKVVGKEVVVRNSIKINSDDENKPTAFTVPFKKLPQQEYSNYQNQNQQQQQQQQEQQPQQQQQTQQQIQPTSFQIFRFENHSNQLPQGIDQKLNPSSFYNTQASVPNSSRVKKNSRLNFLEVEAPVKHHLPLAYQYPSAQKPAEENKEKPLSYPYKPNESEWKPSNPADNRRFFLGPALLAHNVYKGIKDHVKKQNVQEIYVEHATYPHQYHEYGYGHVFGNGYGHGNGHGQGHGHGYPITEVVSTSHSKHGHKVIEVVKKVPVLVPYTVKVPVYKTVAVRVPKPYPFPVEKPVPYVVEMPVPYPVKVPVNVPYEVKVPVKVPHPVLHTVKKLVPYPVEVPHVIEKKVPFIFNDHDEKSNHHGDDLTSSHQDTSSFHNHNDHSIDFGDKSFHQ